MITIYYFVRFSEPKLSGALFDKWLSRPATLFTIDFDHHFTNSGFGDLNILDITASATCVMIYNGLSKLDIQLKINCHLPAYWYFN